MSSFKIYLNDNKDIDGALKWAKQYCPSYITNDATDVSDTSLTSDYIYTFYFGSEKEALMFKMRWV
jgi:hypothetical protein